MCRDGGNLACVVRLHAPDRHERVAALGERVGCEVLELPHLVPSVREPGVAVLALGPDLDSAAEMLAEALEPMHGRGPEQERHALEVGKAHSGDPSPLGRAFADGALSSVMVGLRARPAVEVLGDGRESD